MEAGQYGLTRGTCLLACCLELDAVARLLWISWCVLGGADFFSVLFSRFFLFERTRPAASMRPPLALLTSLLVMTSTSYDLRPRERSDLGCFLPSLFIPGCAQSVII